MLSSTEKEILPYINNLLIRLSRTKPEGTKLYHLLDELIKTVNKGLLDEYIDYIEYNNCIDIAIGMAGWVDNKLKPEERLERPFSVFIYNNEWFFWRFTFKKPFFIKTVNIHLSMGPLQISHVYYEKLDGEFIKTVSGYLDVRNLYLAFLKRVEIIKLKASLDKI